MAAQRDDVEGCSNQSREVNKPAGPGGAVELMVLSVKDMRELGEFLFTWICVIDR